MMVLAVVVLMVSFLPCKIAPTIKPELSFVFLPVSFF